MQEFVLNDATIHAFPGKAEKKEKKKETLFGCGAVQTQYAQSG